VAAFIGSPSMNLVEAEVRSGNLDFAGHTLPLPAGSAPPGGDCRVIAGIRPTDFEHAASADPALPRMRVTVSVVEELGAESHVVFAVDAPRVQVESVREEDEEEGMLLADDQRSRFTARIDDRHPIAPGDTVELAVDVRRLHFFDPDSELALGVPALAGA